MVLSTRERILYNNIIIMIVCKRIVSLVFARSRLTRTIICASSWIVNKSRGGYNITNNVIINNNVPGLVTIWSRYPCRPGRVVGQIWNFCNVFKARKQKTCSPSDYVALFTRTAALGQNKRTISTTQIWLDFTIFVFTATNANKSGPQVLVGKRDESFPPPPPRR